MNLKKEAPSDYARYLSLMALPFLLITAPLCGYFMGRWMDHFWGTDPYLAYIFLSLGMVAGAREFYKSVRALIQSEDVYKN